MDKEKTLKLLEDILTLTDPFNTKMLTRFDKFVLYYELKEELEKEKLERLKKRFV